MELAAACCQKEFVCVREETEYTIHDSIAHSYGFDLRPPTSGEGRSVKRIQQKKRSTTRSEWVFYL